MLIEHEFRIDDFIKDGGNTLTVHIKSAKIYADSQDYPIRLLHSIDPDGCYLRKPPHSFGWDIMPRAATTGLWRGVRLEVRDAVYFSQSFIHTKDGEYSFFYTLEANDFNSDDTEIELEGKCADSHFIKERIVKSVLEY